MFLFHWNWQLARVFVTELAKSGGRKREKAREGERRRETETERERESTAYQ